MRATKTQFLILFLLIPFINVQAYPIPDTGQTKCYNDSVEIACPAQGQPFYGQDGSYTINPHSYTKLGQNGVVLPDSSTQAYGWIMTRDNVTDLIWENKTTDGSVHDRDNQYTWCDTNPATNGGDIGVCYSASPPMDTEAFIKALNDAQYGGFSDWRMPTIKELSSLINSSIQNPGPTIDAVWFPNTNSSAYWSSTYIANSLGAWTVRFIVGDILYGTSKGACCVYVRAVRAGQ